LNNIASQLVGSESGYVRVKRHVYMRSVASVSIQLSGHNHHLIEM